jgi:hypothetical protein
MGPGSSIPATSFVRTNVAGIGDAGIEGRLATDAGALQF